MKRQSVCRIVVIDGQGGKLGRQLVESVSAALPSAEILAVGTNSQATANMLKGGAARAATGENSVCVVCRDADIITGPVGILSADALLGEITPVMAKAIGQSSAKKVLIPTNRCEILIPGISDFSMTELLRRAVDLIVQCAEEKG